VLVRWSDPERSFGLPLVLTNWDFYFLIAGLIGLYAMHRLSLVQEQGEIEPRELMGKMLDDTRRGIRNISTVAGLRSATAIPVSLLRDARVRLRLRQAKSLD
jgi:hypothetical protein